MTAAAFKVRPKQNFFEFPSIYYNSKLHSNRLDLEHSLLTVKGFRRH